MYLFFDTETTGLPTNSALSHTKIDNWPHLVSIAWILCDDNRKIHSIKKYIIKPDGWKIPSAATKVHGISTEQAEKEVDEIIKIQATDKERLQIADYIIVNETEEDFINLRKRIEEIHIELWDL